MARLSQVFGSRDREFFDLFEEAAGNIVRAVNNPEKIGTVVWMGETRFA